MTDLIFWTYMIKSFAIGCVVGGIGSIVIAYQLSEWSTRRKQKQERKRRGWND